MTVNRYHEMNERNSDLSTTGAHHLLSSRTILEIIIFISTIRAAAQLKMWAIWSKCSAAYSSIIAKSKKRFRYGNRNSYPLKGNIAGERRPMAAAFAFERNGIAYAASISPRIIRNTPRA